MICEVLLVTVLAISQEMAQVSSKRISLLAMLVLLAKAEEQAVLQECAVLQRVLPTDPKQHSAGSGLPLEDFLRDLKWSPRQRHLHRTGPGDPQSF